MKNPTVFLIIFFVSARNCDRIPRFIRGTYTKTITETSVATSIVPSSCIYLDATLPPCRNVRYMRFPNFLPNNWFETNNNTTEEVDRSDVNVQPETTPLGWGEYLGLYAPTVTTTITEIQTATVEDPRIVVTYAVKGCKPVKIPENLNRCDAEQPSVTFEDILPTSTVTSTSPITATINPHEITTLKNARFIDMVAARAYEVLRKNRDGTETSIGDVESSGGIQESDETLKATEQLPNK